MILNLIFNQLIAKLADSITEGFLKIGNGSYVKSLLERVKPSY